MYSPIKVKLADSSAGRSVLVQLEAAPAESTRRTSKVKVPVFSFKILLLELITTFGVNSSLVNVISIASEEAKLAPTAFGVILIVSSDSKEVSSIPEILKVADVEPAAILITGFRSNFLNLSSSAS